MLLTITTTREPATDLGYLLHKHPDRLQSFTVATGHAHVFYPEATEARCTAALLLEVDPIALVRNSKNTPELAHYINDRPYAASSMIAVAMKEVFRTALVGRCDARPGLAEQELPLEIRIPALRCRGGIELAKRVFEPLDWTVTAVAQPLDPPEWGDSAYLDVTLKGEHRLGTALNHLYVLLPVLDDVKHYWVSTDEVDKLIRAGGDWLAGHPEKPLITRRYLAHQRKLAESALGRLAAADDLETADLDNAVTAEAEEATEAPEGQEAERNQAAEGHEAADTASKPLAVRRRDTVVAVLREVGARKVADLGCGAGALTRDLIAVPEFTGIIAADVSVRALQLAAKHLHLDRLPEGRVTLLQTSLTYRDDRLAGLDAAVLMEVIEHVDPERLDALERTVFGFAAPEHVIVTTPNVEFNVHYDGLEDGKLRHPDHRFEWTRAQFQDWAGRVAAAYGYRAEFRPVGDIDPGRGASTQLAIFTKAATKAVTKAATS